MQFKADIITIKDMIKLQNDIFLDMFNFSSKLFIWLIVSGRTTVSPFQANMLYCPGKARVRQNSYCREVVTRMAMSDYQLYVFFVFFFFLITTLYSVHLHIPLANSSTVAPPPIGIPFCKLNLSFSEGCPLVRVSTTCLFGTCCQELCSF